MRKITQTVVVDGFLRKVPCAKGNTMTNGTELWLHGHCIAWHYRIAWQYQDGVVIQTCGWNTPTTRDRLNAIPGVHIHQQKGRQYLNGVPWEGEPIIVTSNGATLPYPV